MTAFLDSLDIANRACDHCGVPHILSVDETSNRNSKITNVYDKLRRAELRRNVWKFARRKCVLRPIETSTRILNPADWDEESLYLPGSIVKHDNGQLWISQVDENLGNEPADTGVWDHYFGPLTVHKYDSTVSYNAGELVYVHNVDSLTGNFIVYLSLVNGNEDVPTTTTDWDEDTLYGLNDVVYYDSKMWRSVIAVNEGIEPMNVTPTEEDGDGFDEFGNPYAWEDVPSLKVSSSKWRPLYAGLKNVGMDYLFLANPDLPQNVFRLPAGFLRRANDNPKYSLPVSDEEITGDFITSTKPILNRFTFIADITDVRLMDDMFCEGLGARIASEVVETLTQSSEKLSDIVAVYSQHMKEARTINAIEVGPEEPDEDEFITVRE